MSDEFAEDLNFDAANNAADDGKSLILDIDGFEGPLHLLLELARQQKVDLSRLSILELANQYLDFIKTAQDLRIELAADYLVMAAWLAYLKSRIILPRPEDEDKLPEPDELAAHLAFRLQRLDAMRLAADGLFQLSQIGQSVHIRGNPEGLRSRTTPLWEASLFDILQAYGQIRSQSAIRNKPILKPLVMALDEARDRLRRAMMELGFDMSDWVELSSLLPDQTEMGENIPSQSILASSLVAGLELAKDGEIELRQMGSFAPIYIRGQAKKDTV